MPTTAETPSAELPPVIAEKAAAVARLVADLRAWSARAWEAQAREAATRGELAQVTGEAILMATLKRQALAARAYACGEGPPPAREPAVLRLIPDAVLPALGRFGVALRIWRSGVWRSRGQGVWAELRRIEAYLRRADDPQAAPDTLFDAAAYLAAYPDVGRARGGALGHYVAVGARENRSPHLLFDPVYYAARNAEALAQSGLAPLAHYVRFGARQGRNPHPLFDLLHYAGQAPDLAPGEDMVAHYLRKGWREGLSPSPVFDPAWYGAQAGLTEADGPPLLHYLARGGQARLSAHPLFDAAWYLERNPDVAASGAEPLQHFLVTGAGEGRSPSPWFDSPHYLRARGADLPAGCNPLVDYLQLGAWIVSEPTPGFATFAYIASYPQLVREGVTPLEHYARRMLLEASS